jgi:hypothetical protein
VSGGKEECGVMNETLGQRLIRAAKEGRAMVRGEDDWRIELDMAIRDFANGAEKIAEALNAGGEKAAYIRANARQFGEPLPLQLVCSIWLAMEQLEAAE